MTDDCCTPSGKQAAASDEMHGRHHHSECHAEATEGARYDSVPPGFAGAVYTCPMHPQVRQTKPGSCPICGMGLGDAPVKGQGGLS